MSRRDFARLAAGGGLAMLGTATRGLGETPPEGVRPMKANAANPSPITDEVRLGWLDAMEDPVREALLASGPPDLDAVLGLFPRLEGDPAFDPQLIKGNLERLRTIPDVNTGHPFLDLAIKTGLAHVDATFQGDHPKYGIKQYAQNMHDSFPPIIIATVDALSAWGLGARAAELFRYWLLHLVRDDGTIDYYGPSVSEYGQLLHTAALLDERAGPDPWWHDGFPALDRIAGRLLRLRAEAEKDDGLIGGAPEADERKKVGKYFHNNGWVVKGLRRWADLCERRAASPDTSVDRVRAAAHALADDTLAGIRRTWPEDPTDRWLPPQTEPLERPDRITGTRIASYTNYRYWPELLSSGLLPADMANRVVEARLSFGGQFCGMTRFREWIDDWPLADHLYGLWALGRKHDFLLSLFGHIAYHQAEGHLTAYEQVHFPPGTSKAAYCLPCQLVAARAGRLLVG